MPTMRCPQCKQTVAPSNGVCPRCRRPMRANGKRTIPVGLVLGAIATIVFLGVTALGTLGFLMFGMLARKPAEQRIETAAAGAAPAEVEKPAPKVDPPPPVKTEEKKEPKQPAPPPQPKPPAVDTKEATALADALVRQLNTYRQTAGVELVRLDPELSRGCTAHARYLALNPPGAGDASRMLDEEPGKPGFSDDGRRAASFALISIGPGRGVVDQWMGRLASRVPLLAPDLRAVGLGLERLAGGAWVVVLDVVRGSGDPVVLYPAPNQREVPLTFSGGPELPDVNATAGYPVTATFPPLRKVTQVHAELLDDAGNPVAVWLSTPENPAQERSQRNTVALIARAPLRSNKLYRANLSVRLDGQPWSRTWTFTTEDDADTKGVWAQKALARVNGFRKLAGLPPVTLDPALSRGCLAHARYLALNLGHPATAGLGAHDEDLSLPGASEEGRTAGKASDIAIGDQTPLHGIDAWMATLYHRVPILEPNLKAVGYGCARARRQGWVAVLNVHGGRERGKLRPAPVLYPAPDQTGVPLHFPIGGEEPNPIPDDRTGKAGYPITAFFPEDQPLQSASAILTDGTSREVAVWFSTPETPANPKFARNQGNTVCLIPKQPLRPNMTYTVLVRGTRGGQGWQKSWQFTTGSAGPTPAQAAAIVLQRVNAYRAAAGVPAVSLDAGLSQGCQAHAEYLVRNAVVLTKSTLSYNDEDPALPGFSALGQRTARQSYILSHAPEPATQIDDLAGTALRRVYLLDPHLHRVGVGAAQEIGRGWRSVLDLNGGRGAAQVVVYPVRDQDNVPCAGFDRVAGQPDRLGYPISATFPSQLKVLGGKGTLTDADGKPIATMLSTPERPLDPAVPPRNTVCLYPRAPLRSGQTYNVTLSAVVNGQQWRRDWQFTTE